MSYEWCMYQNEWWGWINDSDFNCLFNIFMLSLLNNEQWISTWILYIYIYTSTTPRTPEISLKFEGTPTRPPCASPRTRVSPHRSLGGTLINSWRGTLQHVETPKPFALIQKVYKRAWELSTWSRDLINWLTNDLLFKDKSSNS